MSKFECIDGRIVITRDPVAPSKFDSMTTAEIRQHAAAGHPEAIAILKFCERPERDLARAMRERRRRVAAEKRAAVEREQAMIAELAATRRAVERAEGRADDAEGREREALDLARRNHRIAVVAVIVAILSLGATVLVAVFA